MNKNSKKLLDERQVYANRYNELKSQFKKNIVQMFFSVAGVVISAVLYDKLHECYVPNSNGEPALSCGTPFLLLGFVFVIIIFKNYSYFMGLFVTKARSEGKRLPLEEHFKEENESDE